MTYAIVFKHSVKKDLRRIPEIIVRRIQVAILALSGNPFPEGVKKIYGYEHIFGLRMGNYRIVYEVATEIHIITVIRIGHRKEVYRAI